MSPLVLVLDQGGHSSRALVFDETGAVIAQASVQVSTTIRQPEWIEQDAAELSASLRTLLFRVADQLGERCSDLQAAALIVQRSSIVAWNRVSHEILSPVLSWQDTRNRVWLEKLLQKNHNNIRKTVRQKTGLCVNAHYGASKMRWLLDNVPEIKYAEKNKTLCIAPLVCFLHQQLTHAIEPVVDAVIASRTLLAGLGETTWSPALLQLFDVPEAVLPTIKPTMADYGAIHVGDYSVPLQLLGGDQSFFAMSHNLFLDPAVVFINVGTGAFIQQSMQVAMVPENLLCAPLCITGDTSEAIMVAEGTVNAAATALDWFYERIGYSLSAADWQLALKRTDDDPVSVPYFVGRMVAAGSPDWLPAGESFFSQDSTVEQQAIAVLESIVFSLQRNLDSLAAVQRCEKIIISGGLSQLDIFCQRLADLAGKSVLRSDDVEACARGAAMQLLPGAAGKPIYNEYIPINNLFLEQRYRQWSEAMAQLSHSG